MMKSQYKSHVQLVKHCTYDADAGLNPAICQISASVRNTQVDGAVSTFDTSETEIVKIQKDEATKFILKTGTKSEPADI